VNRRCRNPVNTHGRTARQRRHYFGWRFFAAHLLLDGYNIRTVQELLGHKDAKPTMVCKHVRQLGSSGVRSPADGL